VANSPQAKKRARQSEKHRQRNVHQRTSMRTTIKNVIKAIIGGNKTEAATAFKTAESNLDKMAGKGIIHKNKAARHKSRLSAKIKSMDETKAA